MNYFMLKGMRDELEKIAGPYQSLVGGGNLVGRAGLSGLGSFLEHMAPAAKKLSPVAEAAGRSATPDLSKINKTIDLAMAHNRAPGLSTRGVHKLAPAAMAAQTAEAPVKATVQKGPGFFGNIKNRLMGRGAAAPTQEFKPFERSQSIIPSPAY